MERRKDSRGRVLKEGESQRKDGYYMYRWTDKLGSRHTVYDKTLEGLRERENKILHDLRDGIKAGVSNVALNDVYEMWKKDKRGLKETTSSNYHYMYEHYVQPDFGRFKIQSIRKSDVRHFYNGYLDTERLAINTLEVINNVLHQVFKLAVEDNYIRSNPAEGVLSECKRAHNYETPKRHALTIPEQKAFIGYIRKTPRFRHWLPLFTFFLGTGCRVSEVVGLRWQDVDMKSGLIEINHNTVYHDHDTGGCYFTVTTPKTAAGNREIPLLPEVRAALMEERSFQREAGNTCNVIIDGYSDFIFLNRFGYIHNPQSINRTIQRIVKSYNEDEIDRAEKECRELLLLPHFSCHNLRHTFATRYCENETNLKVIQEVLGHKDISTTMDIYAEATKEAKKKSFDALSGKIMIG